MYHKPLDKAGIIVAVLCAIHCLLVPVVLPTLALVGLSFLGFELFERIILSISLLIGSVAVFMGMRHHRSWTPFFFLALGGVLYFGKNTFGSTWEPLLILTGAAFIVVAHTLNLHLCRVKNRNKPCEEVEAAQHSALEAAKQANESTV
ncbi:MerC domain-containing protein [Aliidiomarina halalkaliphila]|uniref:MerC domain-containing protein n=1 Tax=Aliidiomarina halalkaliphila TaxID=2593535 RepID=A0A552X0E8_9GAMM|nr:MerC domain-containing protein [Aliidiomarina halalkaliphila]TRW48531.1 MerC domain-containing protein [Aliidiomarina halalkaliphila]